MFIVVNNFHHIPFITTLKNYSLWIVKTLPSDPGARINLSFVIYSTVIHLYIILYIIQNKKKIPKKWQHLDFIFFGKPMLEHAFNIIFQWTGIHLVYIHGYSEQLLTISKLVCIVNCRTTLWTICLLTSTNCGCRFVV